MTMIKVGVIGCGYWGPNLIRNFAEISTSTVVAVADLDQERLDYIQGRYPQIVTTKDYRDLFKLGLDAVVIATPPATHFGLARETVLHGLHVLVEKPLALSSRDAQELIDLAEERDRILMVGHTFEYNPAVRALKQIIDSGEIGDVHYIDAVRVSLGLFQRDLNVLWDLAPHDISILLYILGCDPISTSARGLACVQDGIEDVVYMTLVFPKNVLAHVRLSWLDPSKVRRITVVGSKKMVVYDDVESLEKVRIYDKGVECPPYTNTFGDFQFAYRYGDITIPNIRFTEPLRVECEHFLECISTHKRPQTDGYNGLRVVQIIESAQKSLRNSGKAISIIEDVQLYQETEHLASTDGLTGLYNRRHFYGLLEGEVESGKRYDYSLSLIILDTDDFKAYNDTYGHLAGDALLRELAQLLRQDIRKMDIAARHNGDEFVILLPHIDKKQAVGLAERIRTRVEEHHFWSEDGQLSGKVTISLGMASYPRDAKDPEALLKAADKALFEAKKQGNTVCMYGEI